MMRFVIATIGAVLVGSAGLAAAAPEDGMKVYAAQKCSMCHAIAGKGNPKGALDGVASKYKPAELREWIVNAVQMADKHKATRKPAMKDFSKLPPADIDALVAYLATLKK